MWIYVEGWPKPYIHTYIRCMYGKCSREVILHTMVTMVTMGGDLQPCCLADRLLTGLGQPQINP